MTIAILAHDSRKELALQFCTAYSGILSRNTVIATGTTGRMLNQATGLPVHCYLSGRLGGIQQITARRLRRSRSGAVLPRPAQDGQR